MGYRASNKVNAILRMYMKPACACLLITIILITGCTAASQTFIEEKPTKAIQPDRFDQRLLELRQRIDAVATSLQQAEGLAQKAGLIDLQIAKYFADYIAWELDYPGIMKDALAANDFFDEQETLTPAERDQRYHDHIDRELTGAMALMKQAMRRLDEDAK